MRKQVLILNHSDATQFIDINNQYVQAFDPHHYEVTSAYLTGSENNDTKMRTLGEHVIFLNRSKKEVSGLKIKTIYALIKLCREKKFEIVICHRYKPIYIMMLTKLFCRDIKAIICVLHTIGTMKNIGRKLFTGFFCHRNIIFAGVSNAVRDDLRKSLPHLAKEKFVTLYNAIDVERKEPALLSRQASRKHLQLKESDFVFGTIGRLAVEKDQKTLIQAFSQIKNTCPQAKLIIIGDGKLKSQLKELIAELHLENDVLLTGFISNAYSYLKGFDCFILPSITEGFGFVLLEAMVARCPIIATKTHGIPEVVAHHAVLINSGDVNQLSIEMKKTFQIKNDQHKLITEHAYQHMCEHFSTSAFKNKFWELPNLQQIRNI